MCAPSETIHSVRLASEHVGYRDVSFVFFVLLLLFVFSLLGGRGTWKKKSSWCFAIAALGDDMVLVAF